MRCKPITSLLISDLRKHRVWQFVNDHTADDTAVHPVDRLPVTKVAGKVFGCRVSLANGEKKWAILGNLDAKNAAMNEHFITVSIEKNRRWFHLARYHDGDYLENGPEAFALSLRLTVSQIFPITFDVRRYVKGNPAALAGSIRQEPSVRLTRAQIIAMSVH